MAKKCDFCGADLGILNEYYKDVGGRLCGFCKNCALSFDKLISPDSIGYTEAVEWRNRIISGYRLNPKIRDCFITETQKAMEQHGEKATVPNQTTQTNGNNSTPSCSAMPNPVPIYKRSSVWISTLKIMAALSVLVLISVGAVVGGIFFDGGIIIGILVGGIVGMISISVIMVFLDMAEDIRINCAVSEQTQRTLEAILNKME